ncbi:hypothetical protein ES708_04451 [subsurface metagenome]
MFVIEASGVSFRDVGEGIDLFSKVYEHVLYDYVKDIDPDELSKNAVAGIMENLDPYSSFLPPMNYTQLNEDAEGEFGGLGIEIATVKEYPRVMSYPIPGSPAENVRLRAGDEIVTINGESTRNMTINDVVSRLRGKIGTSVTIEVKRGNREDLLKFEIKRDRISLKNITYAGEIVEGIGYIQLVRFNKEASHELEDALNKVSAIENLKGVVLDIRGNPGGLLTAAQQVADKFLMRNDLIVFTRGREDSPRSELQSRNAPSLHPNIPLVVLVDRRSASASEIVAGAIQDHDRGVLVGETSFGKGSVQTVFSDLPGNAGMKLTTAHYYTPSGRCIHNERNQDMDYIALTMGEDGISTDENDTADSTAVRDKFYTLEKERVVYGGGGVTPDIIIKEKLLGNIVIQLLSQSILMDFTVDYIADHTEITEDFTITDEIIEALKAYISDEEVFTYSIPGKSDLDDFRKIVERENYNGDISALIDNLEETLMQNRDKDFEANIDTIKRYLKRDIASAQFGIEARTTASKDYDVQLQKGIEILNDTEKYHAILSDGAETGVVEELASGR